MHDLPMAKWEAAGFVEYLETADKKAMLEYPKSERLTLEGGNKFFDS
jgi:S-ribosylhomocysteine lyase